MMFLISEKSLARGFSQEWRSPGESRRNGDDRRGGIAKGSD